MIDTIIFDFGDIFINLDKQATISGLQKLGMTEWNSEFDRLNLLFETGDISHDDFLGGFQKELPNASIEEILEAWNAVLADFPLYRVIPIPFILKLSKPKVAFRFIAIFTNVLKKFIFLLKLENENQMRMFFNI
jgi:hypothetical protein